MPVIEELAVAEVVPPTVRLEHSQLIIVFKNHFSDDLHCGFGMPNRLLNFALKPERKYCTCCLFLTVDLAVEELHRVLETYPSIWCRYFVTFYIPFIDMLCQNRLLVVLSAWILRS